MPMSSQKNVLGGELQPCSFDPLTGWTRNGCCETDASDRGVHTVCIIVTDEFLQFSRAVGNDLSTPRPEYGFGGLHEGDRWCLCAARWEEARQAGFAQIGRAHACTTVTNAHLVCRLLIEKKKKER